MRRFVFIVRVDGEEVAKAINKKPRSFSKVDIFEQIDDSLLSQMNVYASNPWHEPMPGKIRNLVVSEKIERTMGMQIVSENLDNSTIGVDTNNSTSGCPKGPSLQLHYLQIYMNYKHCISNFVHHDNPQW